MTRQCERQSSPKPDTTPARNVGDLLNVPLTSVQEALPHLPPRCFAIPLEQLPANLRCLIPGDSYTVHIRGVAQPVEHHEKQIMARLGWDSAAS